MPIRLYNKTEKDDLPEGSRPIVFVSFDKRGTMIKRPNCDRYECGEIIKAWLTGWAEDGLIGFGNRLLERFFLVYEKSCYVGNCNR